MYSVVKFVKAAIASAEKPARLPTNGEGFFTTFQINSNDFALSPLIAKQKAPRCARSDCVRWAIWKEADFQRIRDDFITAVDLLE